MSNDQLRWHLLREVSGIVVKKLKQRKIPPPSPEPAFYYEKRRWIIAPITKLFLSGKGPAQAVQMSLPTDIKLTNKAQNEYDLEVRIKGGHQEYVIKPVYFKKLLLRWARVLVIRDHAYDRVVPKYVDILRVYNSVEELRFYGHVNSVKVAIAVIRVCPKLSRLISDQAFFASLLKRTYVDLTKIRSIEIEELELGDDDDEGDDDANESNQIFEILATHPERCPNLESLTITTDGGLSNLLNSMSHGPIRSVKSLEVSGKCRPTIDFPCVASLSTFFPNIENVSLTFKAEYTNIRSMKPVEMFKNSEYSFNFKFHYYLNFSDFFKTIAEMRQFYKYLKSVMSYYEINDKFVQDRNRWVYFAAKKAYLNKTMEFKLRARGIIPYQWADDWPPVDSNSSSPDSVSSEEFDGFSDY